MSPRLINSLSSRLSVLPVFFRPPFRRWAKAVSWVNIARASVASARRETHLTTFLVLYVMFLHSFGWLLSASCFFRLGAKSTTKQMDDVQAKLNTEAGRRGTVR